MVGRAHTVAVVGLDAVQVVVEAHVGPGLPGLHIIGSSGAAAREAADRVKIALTAAGVGLPLRKQLVSLAPAEVPKVGARFDLAMALALVCEVGELAPGALERTAALGELALDGAVRSVPGVLPSVASLPSAGVRRVLVADADAEEADLVGGVDVIAIADLAEAIAVLQGAAPARRPRRSPVAGRRGVRRAGLELADVRGQPEARRALELAAAGGHHLLLIGPPGCGKSMLASRLPDLLPKLEHHEALEVAAIRSVAGAVSPDLPVLDDRPPFRAPHHTTSSSALLEALREPLEEGVVRIARSKATVRYPARAQLVCAANPCPCGGGERCECPEDRVWRYRARLSGPLADRLDLAPSVEPVTATALLEERPGESTAVVAERVARARAVAADRWGPGAINVRVAAGAVRRTAGRPALRALADAIERGDLTGRGFDRALRVARTIADLDDVEVVAVDHALEALAHRLPLRAGRASPAGTAR